MISWMRKGDLVGLIMNGNSALTGALLEALMTPTAQPAGNQPAGPRLPPIFRINKVVFGGEDGGNTDELEALSQMDRHQLMDLYADMGLRLLGEDKSAFDLTPNGQVLIDFVSNQIF